MAIIECKNVCKNFGEKVALDHVSLEIPEGQIFGLLGPNGAGKTTLIRIINRITIPNGGEVLFNGRPITQDDVARIGYMPEERGLYRKMKVGDQAMYLAQLKGMSAADARAALKDWFVRFGIQSWWDKKVEELSKGMAQKLQFITTVVHKPSLMILDEPFSGFDPVNAEVIRQEILRLKNEGATITPMVRPATRMGTRSVVQIKLFFLTLLRYSRLMTMPIVLKFMAYSSPSVTSLMKMSFMRGISSL